MIHVIKIENRGETYLKLILSLLIFVSFESSSQMVNPLKEVRKSFINEKGDLNYLKPLLFLEKNEIDAPEFMQSMIAQQYATYQS